MQRVGEYKGFSGFSRVSNALGQSSISGCSSWNFVEKPYLEQIIGNKLIWKFLLDKQNIWCILMCQNYHAGNTANQNLLL